MYNVVRRAFIRLPVDVQRLLAVYVVAVHVLLFFAVLKCALFCLLWNPMSEVYWVKVNELPWWPALVGGCGSE